MNIVPLDISLVPGTMALLAMGDPFVRVRSESDYWLYSQLFSSSCPMMVEGGSVIGVVLAFRSQDTPDEIYVQDVMVHPQHRRRGIARALLDGLVVRAETWGCKRIYLTSEAENSAAHQAWTVMGFVNVPGDRKQGGVWIISDYKGPGKDRAVYERSI
jgi:GNAT superfamily N-acetyltransferase